MRRIYLIASIAILCILIVGTVIFAILVNRRPPETKINYELPTSKTRSNTDSNQPKTPVSPKARTVIQHEFESDDSEADATDESVQSETEVEDSNFEDDVLEMFVEIEQQEKEEAEKPKSAFGFGTFPDIPLDYPDTPIWQQDNYPNGDADFGRDFVRSMELMERVMIKLWSQGDRVNSGSMRNGSILPHYPNTVYVEYDYLEEPDGTQTRYVSGVTSGPDVPSSVHDAIMDDGNVPSGITVLDADSEGIDPYSFLNLYQ